MHPREFFWFRTKKYQTVAASRHTSQLSADVSRKKDKMEGRRNRLTLLCLAIVISHGILVPLIFIYLRSMSVAKSKVGVLKGELRQRKIAEHASELQELERLNGKPLLPAEVDVLLQMLDAGETEQDDLHEHISSYEAIRYDVPPPYEVSSVKV